MASRSRWTRLVLRLPQLCAYVLEWCRRRSVRVGGWISTPCTAESRIRQFEFQEACEWRTGWETEDQEHVRIWNRLMLRDAHCLLGHHVSCNLSIFSIVNRCCLDGHRKRWRIASNNGEFAKHVGTGACACEQASTDQITKSGHYSAEVAKHIMRAFCAVW